MELRHLLGPYEETVFVVLIRHENMNGEITIYKRFLDVEKFKESCNELICDPSATVYKIPPHTVFLLTISHVRPRGHIFNLQQLPPQDRDMVDPFPPASTCIGLCPPYEMDCEPPLEPDCGGGSMQCVIHDNKG